MELDTSIRPKRLTDTQVRARILVHLRKKYAHGGGEDAPVYVDGDDLDRAVAVGNVLDVDLERRISAALQRLESDGLVGIWVAVRWCLTHAGWEARKR
jgi:hypothetical protein